MPGIYFNAYYDSCSAAENGQASYGVTERDTQQCLYHRSTHLYSLTSDAGFMKELQNCCTAVQGKAAILD